ncbi:MAG: metallophosphoesterase [Candidatus Fermentibacter sp.]|nr:metallophosphoesterase [Candidatus Fermentibacter sp.]
MHAVVLAALMAAPVRIAVLGDRTTGGDDTEAFGRCVSLAVSMRPDAVISVGDLIEGSGPAGPESQWAEASALLAPLVSSVPFFATPGNHDDAGPGGGPVATPSVPAPGTGVDTVMGVLIVSWDTSGDIGDTGTALRGLDSLLSGVSPESASVLVTHRPCWLEGQGGPGLAGGVRAAAERADIEAVLSGHIHILRTERAGGVLYVSAGPSGGASLPSSPTGATLPQVGWLTVDRDSASFVSLPEGAALRGGFDSPGEALLLGILRRAAAGFPAD